MLQYLFQKSLDTGENKKVFESQTKPKTSDLFTPFLNERMSQNSTKAL